MKDVKFISEEIAREISGSTITDYNQIQGIVKRTLSIFNWGEVRNCNSKYAKMAISKEKQKRMNLKLEAKNKYLRQFIIEKGFDLTSLESDIKEKMIIDGFFATDENLYNKRQD